MLPSIGWPPLELRRCFLSHVHRDASWNGIAVTSLVASFPTEFIVTTAPVSPPNSAQWPAGATQDAVVWPAETNEAKPSSSRLFNNCFHQITLYISTYYEIISGTAAIKKFRRRRNCDD